MILKIIVISVTFLGFAILVVGMICEYIEKKRGKK